MRLHKNIQTNFPKKWFKVSVYYYIYYNKYIFNTGETDEHQTILICLEQLNSQEYFEQTQFIEQDSMKHVKVKLSSTC